MILRHLEPPATANDFATCHVTLFGWRNGGLGHLTPSLSLGRQHEWRNRGNSGGVPEAMGMVFVNHVGKNTITERTDGKVAESTDN
jgi:hypothetical protein